MQKKNAFTLIELLVVISIIGILVGIIMPSLTKARQLAARAVCCSNLHDVAVAFRMYLDQSDDVLPVAAAMPSQHLTTDPPIADVLKPFLGNQQVLLCPSDLDRKYFLSEGSSYEYQASLGGQKVENSFFTQRYGQDHVFVMNDYGAFHGPDGQVGSINFLFADMHVGELY